MRVCDKCQVRLIETTLFDKKYSEEIDLCKECRQIFADWIGRKQDNDPVEKEDGYTVKSPCNLTEEDLIPVPEKLTRTENTRRKK